MGKFDISNIIERLNRLTSGDINDAVALFNLIPEQDRNRVTMLEIVDAIDKKVIIEIAKRWYPEKTKTWPNHKIPEGHAHNFIKRMIIKNPNNFFARINGLAESVSETGEIDVLTARNLKPVQENTRLGCLRMLNPLNWIKHS